MDVRGRPQTTPGMQTRGVLVGKKQRIWVDVFPDTTGMTRVP